MFSCSTEPTETERGWTDRRALPVVPVERSAGLVSILAAHSERAHLMDPDPDPDWEADQMMAELGWPRTAVAA